MMTIGIVVNNKRKEAGLIVKKLINWLKNKKINFYIDREGGRFTNDKGKVFLREELPEKVNLIIVLGGDGTLLNIARYAAVYGTPIMAVNLGSLGFITEIKVEEIFFNLEKFLADKHEVEERMMLEGIVLRQNKKIQKYLALNDIVISKDVISRIIHVETYVDEKYVTTYHSDGLVISSPTGSTAYSLSAGGPIVHPAMEALLLSPICPHTLTNRPIIIVPKSEIKFVLKSVEQQVMITVDGQLTLSLLPGDIIKICRSRYRTKLIVPENRNYFEVLRNKFKWGGA
ncbi:NAD(+)/NADH kinase [Candidatus Poribacteria bacterium]|nr:NAD(+)/NADH kinase [Candidatus Poribacteria bacterium]